MTDLVDRLRNDQPGERQPVREARMELGGLLTEAANEIESLYGQVEDLQTSRARHRADNKRLRESLGAAARVLHKAGERFASYAATPVRRGTPEGDKQWAQRCFAAHDAAQGETK